MTPMPRLRHVSTIVNGGRHPPQSLFLLDALIELPVVKFVTVALLSTHPQWQMSESYRAPGDDPRPYPHG